MTDLLVVYELKELVLELVSKEDMPGIEECAKVSACCMACSADPRLGDGVVVSARYRKDEQALVQVTRSSAPSPRSALG